MKKERLIASLIVAASVIGLPFMASARPDNGVLQMLAKLDAKEARELKQSGKILPLEELIARVQKDYPGQIIEIELDEDKGRFIYDIEIVGEEGVVIELKVDAATGEVLSYKKDY